MQEQHAEPLLAVADLEAARQGVEGGLARPVILPAARFVEADAAEDRAHEGDEPLRREPVEEHFGKADRADRVGEVDLRGDIARHRVQRVVRLRRHAGHHEDQVEARAREALVQRVHRRIVVDVGGLHRQGVRGQGGEARRGGALRRGHPPAPLQEGLDEAEPEAARGPDDERVLLGCHGVRVPELRQGVRGTPPESGRLAGPGPAAIRAHAEQVCRRTSRRDASS